MRVDRIADFGRLGAKGRTSLHQNLMMRLGARDIVLAQGQKRQRFRRERICRIHLKRDAEIFFRQLDLILPGIIIRNPDIGLGDRRRMDNRRLKELDRGKVVADARRFLRLGQIVLRLSLRGA